MDAGVSWRWEWGGMVCIGHVASLLKTGFGHSTGVAFSFAFVLGLGHLYYRYGFIWVWGWRGTVTHNRHG